MGRTQSALRQAKPGQVLFLPELCRKQWPPRVKVKAGAYDGVVSMRTRGTYCAESVSAVWACVMSSMAWASPVLLQIGNCASLQHVFPPCLLLQKRAYAAAPNIFIGLCMYSKAF